MCKTTIRNNGKEDGFALFLVLVILMTLTVVGVGVIFSSGTNSALSRNFEKAVQAQNMAEIGAKIAFRELINQGYLKTTHTENMEAATSGERLIETDLQNYTRTGDGDFEWSWTENSGFQPLWDTDTPHGFRFRVYYSTNSSFVIETEGWYDKVRRRVRARGELENMFQFSYFAAGDMGELARGVSQEIKGKVHANGNLYVRPGNSTLRVNTDSFTASELIIRSRDAWNQPDVGGTCQITKFNQDSGTWVEMLPGAPRGSEGVAFESMNPDWSDPALGVKALWGGVVRDKAAYKSPPPIQGLEVGDYYDTSANLKIDAASHGTYAWCTEATIYNFNELMNHVVKDIDVAAMIAAGDWPANGLIYCSTPIRLYNATQLQSRLTIASNSTIYTKGDFNTAVKQGAALMTKHRIYILSDNWIDSNPKRLNDKFDRPAAISTTINAALVDGAPTVDEYNWVDRGEDHRYDDSGRLIYDNWNAKTAGGFNSPDNSSDPWANCDDLLEDWSGKTLTKFGSTVHLGGAEMAANLNNAAIQLGQLGWIQRSGYRPPTRIYGYDPDLSTPAGEPPFTPLIGHITSWEPY